MQKLNGRQKAAILLISLGPDVAGQVLQHLREPDIERLTKEILTMETVTEDIQQGVIAEMYSMALANNAIVTGGARFAREILARALGEEEATEILSRFGPLQRGQRFAFLKDVDPSHLLNFIQGERPQTVALVLSNVTVTFAAGIFAALSPELQTEVALRIATMDRTSPEIIDSVEGILKERLGSVIAQEFSAAGGVEYLVKLLNSMDRATERRILEYLDANDAELAAEVRKLMFIFDDLIRLDDRSMQRLLREVDSKDLVLALKGASEELREHIFKNQSTRASEMIKEELEVLGPVRLRNIEEAQQRIANIARRLEEAEEIVIAGKGDDAFV